MPNKTTVALNDEQYAAIIEKLKYGGNGYRPHIQVAAALTLQANLGLRIGDVLQLRLCDVIEDAGRYRLDIVEEKTEKKRKFTVPLPVYQFMRLYCMEQGIGSQDLMFPYTTRCIQKVLKKVTDELGYDNISTHSFRKRFASKAYIESGYSIEMVRTLLQHSSTAITSRYIGIQQKEIEDLIVKLVDINM